tara:strand:- start:362 stop:532 length:171 start_codon:yes stop_codon:yes gene_type:complete
MGRGVKEKRYSWEKEMDSQLNQMGVKEINLWKAPFKFKKSRKTMIKQFKKNLGLKD